MLNKRQSLSSFREGAKASLSSGTLPGQFLRPAMQTPTHSACGAPTYSVRLSSSGTTCFSHSSGRGGGAPQCLVLNCLGTYTLIITITYIYWNTDGQTSMPPAVFTLRANVFIILSYDCYPSFNAWSKYLSSTGNVPTALQRFSHFILTVTTTTL